MKSARAWRDFYAAERSAMGEHGLDALLDRAPVLGEADAFVFPHTRASVSGHLVASVATALVRTRARTVLALGVLHGGREADHADVARARAGDEAARARLRGVHRDEGLAAEEFSLDLFAALLERAARREGVPAPELVRRFPFLVGARTDDLPGMAELHALASRSTAIVATTDPIHHGAGYGTPIAERRAAYAATTVAWARAAIDAQLGALARGDIARFVAEAQRVRSDFRDVGPVLAALLARRGATTFALDELVLVDYADVLAADRPTWVAAALARAHVGAACS